MARIHLFEFEDLLWFPGWLRNYMTDFLQFVANQFRMYNGIVPVLVRGMNAAKCNQIIDLASGGGGGWESLSEELKKAQAEVKVLLTDYYPNHIALNYLKEKDPKIFEVESSSVNAMEVPERLKGLRTQFLSIHHFRPESVQKILQNAVDAQAPVAFFEAQKRSLGDFIKFFFSPINVLLVTPFIRPFSIGRIIFTYLIPLVPIFVWWDGLVSVLRTYSKKEFEEIIEKLQNKEMYDWEVNEKKGRGFAIYYLLGIPKEQSLT